MTSTFIVALKWMKDPHVLHDNKWIVFHGLLNIMLGPSKRGGSNNKLEIVAINYHQFLTIIYFHDGDLNPKTCYGPSTWSFDVVHFHSILSLRTQWQHWIWISHGTAFGYFHCPWLVCEVAFNMISALPPWWVRVRARIPQILLQILSASRDMKT